MNLGQVLPIHVMRATHKDNRLKMIKDGAACLAKSYKNNIKIIMVAQWLYQVRQTPIM